MRLIDADELLKKVNSIRYLRKLKAKRLCDECKEIKAIPIEWIEKWGWKNGMSESMSLRVMIDDWEKENGK